MSVFTIYSNGAADEVVRTLNGIASLISGGDFKSILASAAIVGLMTMLTAAAFRKTKMEYQWFLGVGLVYYGLISAKVSVHVEDKVFPSSFQVIDNVPVGLAIPASLISTTSSILVDKFETSFSNVGEFVNPDIRYTKGGVLFSQSLMESVSKIDVKDPRLSLNLSDFWQNCVFYDIALGKYSWQEFSAKTNIFGFLKGEKGEKGTSQVRGFTYTDKSGQATILNCLQGINGPLGTDIDDEAINQQKHMVLTYSSLPKSSFDGTKLKDEIVKRFASSLEIGYSYIAGISATAADAITQNTLANSLSHGFTGFATKADAPAVIQSYISAKADAERYASVKSAFQSGKENLPILQAVLECMIYLLFPFVAIVVCTPGGMSFFKKYVQLLLCVNLWPLHPKQSQHLNPLIEVAE